MGIRMADVSPKKISRELMCVDKEANGVISSFENHQDADRAVKEIQNAGFDMRKLSIIGRDFHTEESVVGFYNLGERTRFWGKQGAFWGGLWGMLFGSAVFIIPGVGPFLVAGTFASTLVGAIEGAAVVGSLSAITAALFSFGIPKNSIVEYETELKAGKYLLIAHGTPEEIRKASSIIKNNSAKSISHFDSSHVQKKLENYFLDKKQ